VHRARPGTALRHLGEHPDVLDVPNRRVLAAAALGDGCGPADGAVCGYLGLLHDVALLGPCRLQFLGGLGHLVQLSCNRVEIAGRRSTRVIQIIDADQVLERLDGAKRSFCLDPYPVPLGASQSLELCAAPKAHFIVRPGGTEAMPFFKISRIGLMSSVDGGARSKITFTLRATLGPEFPSSSTMPGRPRRREYRRDASSRVEAVAQADGSTR
jgi:hypothetical protein